jgi:Queuosine biosynthesis protein QueC
MAQAEIKADPAPSLAVDVTEGSSRARRGWVRCQLDGNIEFNIEDLNSYCFADWDVTAYDALVVAATVEFADKTLRRPVMTWRRAITLQIPVHDPDRWNDKPVADSLHSALSVLTGDQWEIRFHKRRRPVAAPRESYLHLPGGAAAVLPFSDGLDSCAVAGLMARELGDRLIRVRLGTKVHNPAGAHREPFTCVPYKVRAGEHAFVESSARSRGFKFALISGLAAYLVKASQVIVPESGQGALGPALVTVGQAYEDYRSHPVFTQRMETFLEALFGHHVRFAFPRLWSTKAETLRTFVADCAGGPSWAKTWSCWQQNRHVSVDGKKRHCGICAACMLRRLSIHAAGLEERPDAYVWENLGATSFEGGAAGNFDRKKITGKLKDYAIAGALHLDHLAGLRASPANARTLALTAFQVSRALNRPEQEIWTKLDRLLSQHENEWRAFMSSLGALSFVTKWAVAAS